MISIQQNLKSLITCGLSCLFFLFLGNVVHAQVPTVTSFSPASQATGGSVVIKGTNFSGSGITTSSVTFGNTAAASFTVNSATQITATVGAGTTGSVAVTTNKGTGSKSGFTYTAPSAPTITSFTPVNAASGTSVTITGTNFSVSGVSVVSSVKFGGTAAASFTVNSSTSITAVVASGSSGGVSVTTTGGGPVTLSGFSYETAPTITSFTYNGTTASTLTAPAGASVTITGTGFGSNTNPFVTAVSFGGTAAASFSVTSSTTISATIGAGTSGNVVVTNAAGSATKTSAFTFIPTPTITNYTYSGTTSSSLTAPIGASVVINGTNFSGTNIGTSTVTIGGVSATVTNTTSTALTATIGASATSGNITVTNNGGTATGTSAFTLIPTPTITSFTYNGTTGSTLTAPVGAIVTITGTNFSGTNIGTSTVMIGGVSATNVTVNSATSITATIGTSATSGNVTVTNNGGTATATSAFTLIPAPTIASYTYKGTSGLSSFTAPSGASVTIVGTNLSGGNEGTVTVTIGGVSATITSSSSTALTVTIGANASVNSNVVVTNTGGTATGSGVFTYIPTPTITSFTYNGTTGSTLTAPVGAIVTITGTNFSGTNIGTSTVAIGGVSATNVTINSATSITATVGTSATSGNITVTNNGGTATATSAFTLIAAPTIASFTYNGSTGLSSFTAPTGASVTIVGSNLSGGSEGTATVSIGGVSATVTSASATSITATIGSLATSGDVTVTNIGGSTTASGVFTLIPTPTITSFTFNGVSGLSSFVAATGASVTIIGTNFSGTFSGTTTVTIGGVSAASVTVNSSTSITAVIGASANVNGDVVVSNNGGTATASSVFTYIPTPTIASFTYNGTTGSTLTAPVSASVVINGTNFSGANIGTSTVIIGGVSATVTNTTSTAITATIGAGAASGDISVTNDGGTATSSGAFTLIAAPTITSFTPTSAGTGATVTILGSNFSGTGITVSSVSFGGTAPTSYNVVDANTISAVVAGGTSGDVSVTTTGGTATLSGFSFLELPVVSSISPSTAFAGDLVTISGSSFTGATAVQFGTVSTGSLTVINDGSISVTVPTGVTGGVYVSVTTAGGTSNTITGSTDSITINSEWTGASSSDWFDANSWSSLLVPGTEDVTVPSGLSTYPVLSSVATVGNLILNGTVSLNGQSLEISTSLTGTGTIISNTASSLDMEGSGTVYFDPSNNSIGTLTINNTVSLGNALNIYGILYPNGGTLNTNGYLTMKNTSIAQAAVVAEVGGTINGNVTVERYIPQNTSYRAFRDLCPMVANAGSIFNNWQEGGVDDDGYGVQITGIKGVFPGVDPTKGFDISPTGNGSMQTYTDTGWGYAYNTKTMTLDPAQGYRLLIRGNRSYSLFTTPQPVGMNSDATLRATGNLVTGTVTYTTGGTSSTGGYSSSYGLNSGTGAYSFIGNPYLSTVSWTSTVGVSQGIQPYYYYLDPTFEDGSGYLSYVTFNSISGTNSNASSNIGDDIQPGQAIFVQQDGSGTSPQVVFQESNKTTGDGTLEIFGTPKPVDKIGLQLWKSNRAIDGAALVFKTGFTNAIGKEDTRKLLNVGENLTFLAAGQNLCIEGIGLPTATDTINLQLLKILSNTSYQLKLNGKMFNGYGMNAYVKDAFLDSQTLVSTDSTVINFTTTKDSASYFNRFSIVFSPSSPLAINNIQLSAVYLKGDDVNVNWSVANESSIARYSLQRSANGTDYTEIESIKKAGLKNYNYTDSKAIDGLNYYRIEAVELNGEIIYSPVAKVFVGSQLDNNIVLYPNPVVSGKTFNLKLDNLIKGGYSIKIYNSLGESILSKHIVHNGGNLIEEIPAKNLSSGMYTVKVVGDTGSNFVNQIIVQ